MFSYQPSYYTTSPFNSFFVQPDPSRRATLLRRQRELEAARLQEARRTAVLQRQREIEAAREEQRRLAEARHIQHLRRQEEESRAGNAYLDEMRRRRPSLYFADRAEEDDEEYYQHPFFPFMSSSSRRPDRAERRRHLQRSSSPHKDPFGSLSKPVASEQRETSPVKVSAVSPGSEQPLSSRVSERHVEAATLIQTFWRTHITRKHALSQIATLRDSFRSLYSSFTFPPTIDFLESATSTSPRLAYTANNRQLLAFEDAATKLLTQLDAIESAGDYGVRAARKGLVVEIEEALRAVEAKKSKAWGAQQISQSVAPRGPVEDSPSVGAVNDADAAVDAITTCVEDQMEETLVASVVAGAKEPDTIVVDEDDVDEDDWVDASDELPQDEQAMDSM